MLRVVAFSCILTLGSGVPSKNNLFKGIGLASKVDNIPFSKETKDTKFQAMGMSNLESPTRSIKLDAAVDAADGTDVTCHNERKRDSDKLNAVAEKQRQIVTNSRSSNVKIVDDNDGKKEVNYDETDGDWSSAYLFHGKISRPNIARRSYSVSKRRDVYDDYNDDNDDDDDDSRAVSHNWAFTVPPYED